MGNMETRKRKEEEDEEEEDEEEVGFAGQNLFTGQAELHLS